MSRATRNTKLERHVRQLETEFKLKLVAALRKCEAGQQGLFGQADAFFEARYLPLRSESEELLGLGREIAEIRSRLGKPEFPILAAFHAYRNIRGANAPGEPKLAAKLLNEIASSAL